VGQEGMQIFYLISLPPPPHQERRVRGNPINVYPLHLFLYIVIYVYSPYVVENIKHQLLYKTTSYDCLLYSPVLDGGNTYHIEPTGKYFMSETNFNILTHLCTNFASLFYPFTHLEILSEYSEARGCVIDTLGRMSEDGFDTVTIYICKKVLLNV
jgi:hypothetical protein